MIICDLDDTLVATSATITPVKVELIYRAFLREGFPDDRSLWCRFQEMTQKMSTVEALKIFLAPYSRRQELFCLAEDILKAPLSEEMKVEAIPGVFEVLPRLKAKGHSIYCLSFGYRPLQLDKLEKARIDFSLFSNIIVTTKSKAFYYRKIYKESGIESPLEVLACGDRIGRDLRPAKALGFRTILMRQGRGLKEPRGEEEVDFECRDFYHLEEIVEERR